MRINCSNCYNCVRYPDRAGPRECRFGRWNVEECERYMPIDETNDKYW